MCTLIQAHLCLLQVQSERGHWAGYHVRISERTHRTRTTTPEHHVQHHVAAITVQCQPWERKCACSWFYNVTCRYFSINISYNIWMVYQLKFLTFSLIYCRKCNCFKSIKYHSILAHHLSKHNIFVKGSTIILTKM